MFKLLFVSLLLLLTLNGCKGRAVDDSANTNSSLETRKDNIVISDEQESSCGLIVDFIEEQIDKSSGQKYYLLYIQKSKTGELDYRQAEARVMKIKHNRFVQIIRKDKISRYFTPKMYDYETRKYGPGWTPDNQKWNEIVVHPMWENSVDLIIMSREIDLITPTKDISKQKYMREHFTDIEPGTIPLEGEQGYYGPEFYFVDNRYVLSMYDNVLNMYDGYMYANNQYSCWPDLYDDDYVGHPCAYSSCVTYATAFVLSISDKDALSFNLHRSMQPEYFWNGEFRPIFANREFYKEDGVFVKKDSVYGFDYNERSFAFSPYASNIFLDDDEQPYYGLSIVSPRINSIGRQLNCTETWYDTWSSWGSVYGEQSIIYGIPYEKAPDTVKPIIDHITRAPNGCGEIDWKKQELVLGDRRFPAPWLKEDIAGIYWLEPGEEFPIDRLVPDTTVEYIDWDSPEQSGLPAAQAAPDADNSVVESVVPSKPPKLTIKCMSEEDALALCKSGNLTQKIYDQSCNRKIWHLSENCPDMDDWDEEEHYHNGEYDEPPVWLHEDCALVDENGEFVTGFQYWEINPIGDDEAQKNNKMLYSFANEKGDYGLLDAYGTEIIPPQFHRIQLQNGYIIATVFKSDDSCVFEELNGRKVYDHAPAYQYCKNEDGEHSVFTPDGRLIVDYKSARDWFHKRHPDLSVGREFVEFRDTINYRIESSILSIPELLRKGYFDYFSVRTDLRYDYNGRILTDYIIYESLYTSSYGDAYLKDISRKNADMVLKLYPDTNVIDTIISINEKDRFITVTYSLRYTNDFSKTVQHSLYFDFELNPIDDIDKH